MGRSRVASAELAKPEVIQWSMPEQKEAYCYGPAPLCLSGGFGASKTYGFFLKIMELCQDYPGNRGIVLRSTEKDIIHTTLPTMFKIFKPQSYRYSGRLNMEERYLRLNNGSEILWWYTKGAASDLSILRGLEINWFFINQGEDFTEEVFDTLDGRLGRWDGATVDPAVLARYEALHKRPWPWRHSVTGKPRPPSHAMVDCNPTEDLDHWIYRRFHPESDEYNDRIVWDREHNDFFSYREKGYKMINMVSLNNRFLSDDNKNKLMAKGKEYVDRFVYGKWGVGEGQIHDVRPESEIPGDPEWVAALLKRSVLYRILDYGDSSPTCCGWMAAERGTGNLYFYAEHYKADPSIRYHRDRIRDITFEDAKMLEAEPRYDDLADPSIFGTSRQKGQGRKFVSDEYTDVEYGRDNRIYFRPADNDEMSTRARINEYLTVDPGRTHPYTGLQGAPRLFFILRNAAYPRGIHKIRVETGKQRRKKIDVVNGRPVFSDERDEKVSDHGYDVLRYGVADRPIASSAKKKDDEWSVEDLIARFQKHSARPQRVRHGRRAMLGRA